MRIRKHIRVGLLVFVAVLAAAAAAVAIWKQPRTPPILGADGRAASESVASLEQVDLGGVEQWILIRGRDTSKPVLLFLHGGPGMPMMYLAHAFQRPLEDEFVVVQWDRLGAGKSYDASRRPEDMRVSRLLADTRELIDLLKRRFGVERIFLAGHSFGSYLGMLYADRHPEDLHAYVGIGQVVDSDSARQIQERFIRRTAVERDRPEAIAEIDSIGPAGYETWLFEFGAEIRGETSWWPLLRTGMMAPEYGLADIANVPKGSSFSSRHMHYDVLETSLLDGVLDVDVPVYFFTGRFDVTTPFDLVELYYDRLEAPSKSIVWFEDSAHFPFFEEPGAFADAMVGVREAVLP